MKLVDVVKEYCNGYSVTRALSMVNFEFPENGLVVLTGKSGCGKTTMLYALSGIIKINEGYIENNNVIISDFSEREWDDYRNATIGFVFQDYKLFEEQTVYENLNIALDIQKREKNNELINNALNTVALSGCGNRKVYELSGGQKQRVAIARAVVKNSSIILADEPTGNLDEKNSIQIWELLKELSSDHLIVAITHDCQTARKYADCVVQMIDGEIKESVNVEHESTKAIKIQVENEDEIILYSSEDLYNYIIKKNDEGINTITFTVEEQEENRLEKNVRTEKSEIQIKGLSINSIGSFAINLIKRRLGKHILTALMLAFALLFAYAAFMLYSFSYGETIIRYAKEHDNAFIEIVKPVEYVNGLELKQYNELGRGKVLYDILTDALGENAIIPVKHFLQLKTSSEKEIDGISCLYTYNVDNFSVDGQYPAEINEIMITDYIMNKLGITEWKNEKIIIESEEYSVTGVIKTDYLIQEIDKKQQSQTLTEVEKFKLENEYKIVVCNPKILKKTCDYVPCEASNFNLYNRELGYLESCLNYGQATNDLELLYGRLPVTQNEIVISYDMYTEDINGNEFRPYSVQYIDIYNEKYKGFYSGIINLFDYFETPTVVGVVSGDSNAINVYVYPTVYEKIQAEYMKYYRYDNIAIRTDLVPRKFATKIDSYELRWNEPVALKVFTLKNSINALHIFISLFFIATIIIAIIMLINCISFSVNDSSRTIGILRALGVRRKDTFFIFVMETLFVLILSVLLANVMVVLLVEYINYSVYVNGNDVYYRLFVVDGWNVMFMNFLAIISGVIATSVPLMKLSKVKIIELINKN